MDKLALWTTHLIFIVLLLVGIWMIFSGEKKSKCAAEVWIQRFFGWGFVLINGLRWALFIF
ncbi:MAG: hypothetical protein P9M08_01175 [Candidatus Erginobacter occultus]|jgi:hypothetical protein|nr:hypothetical protein [Candidatus Erginobacter occultus]